MLANQQLLIIEMLVQQIALKSLLWMRLDLLSYSLHAVMEGLANTAQMS